MTPAADLWVSVASTTGASTTGMLPLVYILGGGLIALFFVILLVRSLLKVIHWMFF